MGAKYIHDVLLVPQSSRQLGSDWEFLMSASVRSDANDKQNRIGDLMAKLIGQIVIAECIYVFARDMGDPRKNKALTKAYGLLRQVLEVKSQTVREIIDSQSLNVIAIAERADQGLNYVLNSQDRDVILYDETGLSTEYRHFRYQVMQEVPPSYLSKMFRSEINRYLGVDL